MKKLFSAVLVTLITMFLITGNSYGNTGVKTVYTNTSFNYSVSFDENSYSVVHTDLDNNSQERSVLLQSRDNDFSVRISCDRLDSSYFDAIREYLLNYSLSDDELFKLFTYYKQSYYRTLQDEYNKQLVFGSSDNGTSETNMKIFSEHQETVYGVQSSSILFNTIRSSRFSNTEETHIHIAIPVLADYTLYSVDFIVKAGTLDEVKLKEMSQLVNSISIDGLNRQKKRLKILSDIESVNSANIGIYPRLEDVHPSYTEWVDNDLGYKITYPSTFMPYKQNSIIDTHSYKSFKVNFNHFFSITSEPALDNDEGIQNKINFVKDLYRGKINITSEGKSRLRGRIFYYIKYSITEGNQTRYIQDYFIIENFRLYNIQLNSRFKKPSKKLQNEFMKIVRSLTTEQKSSSISKKENIRTTKFIDNNNGVTFAYPDNWRLIKNNTTNDKYALYNIKNQDFSGGLEIVVSEGELKTSLLSYKKLNLLSNPTSAEVKRYFKNYTAPYIDRPMTLLASSRNTLEEALYFTKLVNFIDSNGRGKLCYSVDIIHGKKTYSLFITVSDYLTSKGKISNTELDRIVKTISRSFNVKLDTL